jgi:hypothetical protein
MTPNCLGIKAAAAALGVCDKILRQLINAGLLPVVRLPSVKYDGERGERVLILLADLHAFAERHREPADALPPPRIGVGHP